MRGVSVGSWSRIGPAILFALGVAMVAGAVGHEPTAIWLGLGDGLGIVGALLAGGFALIAAWCLLDARALRRNLRSRADQLEVVLNNMSRGITTFDRDGRLS